MGTGAKIAIGCVVAVAVAGMVVVAVVVGGAYWAKGKAEEMAAGQQKIQDFQRQADANSFVRPSDGRITEPRLVKFLEVRKDVFAVYQKYAKDIEARKNKEQVDFGDVKTMFNVLNDIRLAQARAQAAQGMSTEEYAFMIEQVYKSAWASEVTKATGGKNLSEAASEATEQAARQMEEQAEQGGVPEQAQKAMREAAEKMRKGSEEIAEQAQALDVPPENVALFRKYESEIKKYAMTGLEAIGL
ncbi:MAG TPA: hypothetical protein VJU18_01380 [Vicinamibacteria bacterium]|nr:hypothetical protein [Vicinamibacteria bacterium]